MSEIDQFGKSDVFLIYDRSAVLSPKRCQVAAWRDRGDQYARLSFHGCMYSWEFSPKLFRHAAGDGLFARRARITTEVNNYSGTGGNPVR